MKRNALAALFAVVTMLALPGLAAAQAKTSGLTVPVVGSGANGTFAGTLQVRQFANSQGQLVASGLLTGVVTSATGATATVARTVTLPATVGAASCDILHLDLGPLHLDLLGLQIDLSRIVLDITAEAGAGNLLGNLLCGVTNLLNDPSGLARLLNNILSSL